MNTLRNILAEAISNAGITISDRHFISWYNEAVSKLSMMYNTAKIRSTQVIICTDENTEYPLTSGSVGIIRVLDSSGEQYVNFMVRENSMILFAAKGTFTLYLYAMPSKINSVSGDSVIPEIYNNAIVYYVVAMALRKYSTEKSIRSDAADAMVMFNSYAQSANDSLRKNDNRYKQVAVRRFY